MSRHQEEVVGVLLASLTESSATASPGPTARSRREEHERDRVGITLKIRDFQSSPVITETNG